jgi:hypothetical protein
MVKSRTVICSSVVWIKRPEVPVMVNAWNPPVAALSVRTVEFDPPLETVMRFLDSDAFRPEVGVTVRLTIPAKSNRLVIVITDERDELTLNFRLLGLALIVNSGFGTIRRSFNVLVGSVPLVPVKVTV